MKKILGILSVMVMIINCNNSSSQNDNDPFTSWALQNSYEIKTLELTEKQKDLNPLKQIVGKAEVVCLGESRHDIHEQFQLKHRFIKYLVEEMGFTAFILEASLPYSNKINEYVLYGKGNINEIMADMPGWFLWDTREMTNIFNWLRDFNKNNKKQVKFYGIDIVAPNNALEQIFEYLKNVDKQLFEKNQNAYYARNLINDNNWPMTLQQYSALPAEQKQILSTNYNELYNQIKQNKNRYIAKSSNKEYDWILRLAYCAKEANKMFSAEKRIDIGLIRDNAMAQNALWIIKEVLENEKVIIWAHNVHITKGEFTMTGVTESIKGMGWILSQELKNRMVAIGASFNQGVFQESGRTFPPAEKNTFDGTLANLKMDCFLMDLRGETDNENVRNWLNSDKITRGQEFEMTFVPAKSFDAIYFIDNISKVNYNQSALEKFSN